ncbi:MAG TPA: LptF/LptG family permease, partial [Candidatus Goldiibacteriota bacterium]|nr:LptF/LptG family permease [Candidatus Goldiibacteriota bacterium]
IGFFVFTFLLIMNTLFVLSDLVIKYGVGLFNVIKMLLLLLPSTAAVTVPMAVLVGVLMTYSRLVQDNEYSGMQACGISIKSISVPAIAMALFVTVFMLAFNNYVLPWANLSYKKLYYEIIKKRSSMLIQQHQFIKDFDNYIFYIGERDNKNDSLKNIAVFVKPQNQKLEQARVIVARTGKLLSDEDSLRTALKLENGIIQSYSFDEPSRMSHIYFGTNYIDLNVRGVFREKNEPGNYKGTREMTVSELITEAKLGQSSTHDRNWVWVELHKKFSIPFAVLAFTLIGIPLGLMTKKGGRLAAISFSIVLIFIYYVLLTVGQTYGYRGKWDYFIAVWLPNIFLAALGLVLYTIMLLPAIKRFFSGKGSASR